MQIFGHHLHLKLPNGRCWTEVRDTASKLAVKLAVALLRQQQNPLFKPHITTLSLTMTLPPKLLNAPKSTGCDASLAAA